MVGRASRKSEPLFLERLPVNSCDDNALFAAKLAGGYDWVSTSQYISKTVQARLRVPLVALSTMFPKTFL